MVMLHTTQGHHNDHAIHYSFNDITMVMLHTTHSFRDITMIMLHTARGHHNGHATHCSGTSQWPCYTLLTHSGTSQ